MDWSFSPLVALYFAAQRDENDPLADGCLWGLLPGAMNHQMTNSWRLFAPDETEVREFANIAFEPHPPRKEEMTGPVAGRAIATGTREIDPRVLVQQGSFTIHADAIDLADVPYVGSQTPWRIAFRVPSAEKDNILERLQSLGISLSTLFPDLAALAQELKGRHFS
jgi:hypothetical protein